ncbi:DUF2726 domain-containing protein [Vibrio astriarenae]|uniref:DUF2726 domain-containing protein n=1 Tax=Vibrio astriarenae TaxID=1481923 RepID=A0A7Z2T3D8_9VIBR|nr:DUF2726 domain-containing protein [Vibrio astriarenae]QIA63643.1 DUF2726 domain-containing protein [Vibrio astriarenae]
MQSIFIILIVLVVFFVIVQKRVIKPDELKDSRYKKKAAVLNNQEIAFLQALQEAVGKHGIIMPKIAMTKVIAPIAANKKQWFVSNTRIAKSYFDYVICDPRTMEARVVIELDDGRELDKGKAERQKLLIHVCKSSGLPLIGTSHKHSYQVGRLRRLLAAHIDLIEPDQEVRFCKKCHSPMVIKVASQGDYKGRRFFICSRAPHCNYTENYNVVFESQE